MGRGRSSSGRGMSSSGSRGMSRSSARRNRGFHSGGSRTTIIVGGRTYSSGNSSSSANSKGVLIAFAILFAIVGFFILSSGILRVNKSNDYGSVSAECLYNQEINNWHYTTYEYYVNGQKYVSKSSEGWEFPEQKGKIVTIYYEKDNPYNITEIKPETDSGATWIILGSSILLISGILVFCLIKMKKSSQKEVSQTSENIPAENSSEKIDAPQLLECRYCGSKFEADKRSCPNCGASRY